MSDGIAVICCLLETRVTNRLRGIVIMDVCMF